ncbi:hypothetical protein BDV12DRAFT_210148 [Aspergillus spectabilis]
MAAKHSKQWLVVFGVGRGKPQWQLVGYGGRKARDKEPAVAEPHAQTSSRNTTKPEAQKKPTPTGSANPGPPSKNHVSARGTTGTRGRGRGRGTAPAGPSHASRLLLDSPAKSRWRDGSKPDSLLQLPAAFGTFKNEFIGAARTMAFGNKTTAAPGLDEVLRDVSKRTGAYISRPVWSDQVIKLWGEPGQVIAVEQQLKAIIAKCNLVISKPKGPAEWGRIHAYSTRKEANAESVKKGEVMMNQLREPPEPNVSFPEQLVFLWPTDGPSLCDCLGPHLESLDEVRASFGCHVFMPKDMPGYICALGHDHDDIKYIAKCIRTLWAEAVAKTNVKTKIYLVEPPSPKNMKTRIMVTKQNKLHKPALGGSLLKGRELQSWQDRIGAIQSKNNSRLVVAVEDCLKSIAFVRGHLRMRVNLGTFVLEAYQVPENNKSWYGYEEFREMLLHEQSKGRLFPGLKVGQTELLERCFKASHLFEPCDNTSNSLESAKLAYSVNFEFLGAGRSMLRMEAEFAKRTGARDFEITERRWLRPRIDGRSGDKRPPLHIAVIDFERSDWQLELKSLEFHQASTIDAALREFSHKIAFRCPEELDNISAKPKRKVIFPSEPAVSRIVEKSAIRFRFKGTQYVFEIARYDEYRRLDMPFGVGAIIGAGGMSDVPYTSWGASIFLPDWDNSLGVHANLPVGQSASYSPSLVTFFPSKEPSSAPEDPASGFWEFIDLVKQAAELLGPSDTSSDNSGVDAASEAGLASLKGGSSRNEATPPVVPSAPSPTGMIHTDLGTLF